MESIVRLTEFTILCLLLFTACSFLKPLKTGTAGAVLKNINGEPVVPRSANKIFVPTFINRTKHVSITEHLTLKLRKHINTGGRLITVSKKSIADLELIGRIDTYELQPIRYNTADEPVLKRLQITVYIWLNDLRSGKMILFKNKVQAFKKFSDRIPPVRSETQVRNSVLEQLSRRIAITASKGWYTELMSRTEKGK